MTQDFYIGNSAISDLQRLLQSRSNMRLFIVLGKRSYAECGAKSVIDKLLSNISCQVTEFSGFSPNPTIEEVNQGILQCVDSNANCILAIGGGSALDTAKLIRHMIAQDQGVKIPLIAVPTTSGTGAEATRFAVVYVEGKKQSIEGDTVLPDVAIVYPPFTYHNPKYLTACTGFDALAQAIESFWAKGATAQSKEYAVKAIELLWKNLSKVVNQPNDELRDITAQGAYWAGRAINISKTTAPHAFSYTFTSKYGYPHGHAVALTFPFFLLLNADNALLDLLNLNKDNCLTAFENYIETIGLTQKMDSKIDIPFVVSQVNTQRLQNNPIDVDETIANNLIKYLQSKQ